MQFVHANKTHDASKQIKTYKTWFFFWPNLLPLES